MKLTEKKLEELFDNYINGNLSDVKATFESMKPLQAAYAAEYIDDRLSNDGDMYKFLMLLRKWAEVDE